MYRAVIVSLVLIWLAFMTATFGIFGVKYPAEVSEIHFLDASAETAVTDSLTAIQFPYKLENTDILIKGLYPYDGPYWEDGSGAEVTGVAALLVENVGSFGIDKARITVCQGKRLLRFNLKTVPPGATVAVLEENMAGFGQEGILYCFGSGALQLQGWDMSDFNFENIGLDELCIKNISDKRLTNIRLFYNDYLQGMYIGGAPYKYIIDELQPGEEVTISPDRYACGISRILCIQTE